jgi:TP901 family phage tail tape measure protein
VAGFGEAFTVLAVFEAYDKMSGALEKMDASLGRFGETAQKTATVAAEAGARIDESMLKTASGADAVEVADARLEAAQSKLTIASREQATAEQELLDIQARAAAGMEDAVATEAKLAAAADTLAAADKRVAAASKAVADAQKVQADTARAAAASTEASAVKTDVAAAAAGRAGKASAAAAEGSGLMGKAMNIGALAVAAVGYESVKAAASFQTLTTRLVTTAGEAPSALGKIQQGILQISVQTGTSANELAKSMYIVEAAGYDAAHGGLDVLKASTEGAALEGSDFATVSNAVTDILKDYHLKAADSANVTSQLVAAVSSGKANFQQMSSSMANILPLAASVHLKFADVAGVLATMTSHGVSAQRASQNMANALRSLEAPTGTMTTEFKKLGITSDEVQKHLSTQGLSGTLQWLSQVAEKGAPKLGQTYPAALKALMGTAAGLNVALMTTGENSKQTADAVARISKATADAHGNVSGFSNLQHTFAFQMDQAKAAISAAGISIGNVLLPAVTSIARAIAQVVGPMATWMSQHQKIVGLIAAVAGGIVAGVAAMKAWAAIQGAINALMAVFDAEAEANPIGIIVVAIAALVAGLIYAYTHFKGFRDVVNAVFSAVKDTIVGAWHVIQAVWNALVAAAEWVGHAFSAAFNAVADVVKTVWGVISGIWDTVVSVTTSVWNGISGFFSKWWPLLLLIFATPIALLIGMWNHFHSAITSVAKAVWNALSSFFVGAWHVITSAAQVAWNLFKMFVITPIKDIWSFIQPVIHTVISFLSSAWHSILSGVQSDWGLIKHYIIQPLVDAWNWLSGWIGKFLDIGTNIVMGIIHGVESAASWLFDSLKNLAQGALNAAKSILGINSPSRLFADEVGKWIPHGIAAGVDQHAQVAHAAVRRLSAGMTAAARVAVTGSLTGTVAGGSLSAVGAGGGVGGVVAVTIDLRNAVVANDASLNQLADRVGKQVVRQFTLAGHKAVAY